MVSRRGHEVHLFARAAPGQDPYSRIDGVHLHRIPYGKVGANCQYVRLTAGDRLWGADWGHCEGLRCLVRAVLLALQLARELYGASCVSALISAHISCARSAELWGRVHPNSFQRDLMSMEGWDIAMTHGLRAG